MKTTLKQLLLAQKTRKKEINRLRRENYEIQKLIDKKLEK